MKRPSQTTCIIANTYFGIIIVKYHRCINIYNSAMFLKLEILVQFERILRDSNPYSIYEHAHFIKCITRLKCLNSLYMLVDMRMKRLRITMCRNMRHIANILHDTNASTFRCLRRTQKPPRCVVQLSRGN